MSTRIMPLNENATRDGKCVVYVMSRDQRVHDNHALHAAQEVAIENSLPLTVVFNLLSKSGVRSREHFAFMLAGLKELEAELKNLGIGFELVIKENSKQLAKHLDSLNPASLYFDFSPLRGPRQLHKHIAAMLSCPCFVVDTHNIIPVWVASPAEEFAAHTFRSKVHKQLAEWLDEPLKTKKHPIKNTHKSNDWKAAENLVSKIKPSGVGIEFKPGEKAARQALQDFIRHRLKDYALNRNNPTIDGQSDLSPYLHYGMISSLRVALEVSHDHTPLLIKEARLARSEGQPSMQDSIDAFLEELIVRKELSDNYCFYNNRYDSIEGARDWAKKSLNEHQHDKREYIYDLGQLEKAETHDEAWNAAQKQLTKSGKIHGYMRMYWAKKILEWSKNPAEAVKNAIYLNDHYSIDGGDPNGYVGILWSIAGLHDRPWFEREIFGKIRFMSLSGLQSKFDVKAYAAKWL